MGLALLLSVHETVTAQSWINEDLEEATDLQSESGRRRYTDEDVRLALAGRSVMVQRIVFCEVGRSGTYDPYTLGGQGEIGPGQLLPGPGNGLEQFYRDGYTDPYSPYQVTEWISKLEHEGRIVSQYPRTRLGCRGSP